MGETRRMGRSHATRAGYRAIRMGCTLFIRRRAVQVALHGYNLLQWT